MQDNIGLLNFRIRTIGSDLSCTMGMIVRKDIGLNLPPRPYARHVSPGGGMMGFNFPMPEAKERKAFSEADQGYFTGKGGMQGPEALEEFALQNFFLFGGSTRPEGDKFDGTFQTVGLNSFYPHYLPDFDYIELNIGCAGAPHELLAQYFYIWGKRAGKSPANPFSVWKSPDAFVRFEIPAKFRNQVAQTLDRVVPNYAQPIADTWLAIGRQGIDAVIKPVQNSAN